ncbi:hypothetical protein PHLCEN_2v5911 [Hermanssonia centrifuga]|uniref:WD repeat-containing protein 8 n=1 Tax=Hermanssonia centrifuga TaxID=98765 RepID=A0A2R6P1R8_9APHY|nr:hypothetical protein PHLCEN_2v5911 [Hermanssonia centrifuga]
MDFTEIYKQTAGLVSFSPGAHFILTAVQDRLVIRRADSFQINRTWQVASTPDTQLGKGDTRANAPSKPTANTSSTAPSTSWITHAAWSCDSEFVLAACAKSGTVNVFKLRDEAWNARVEAGAEGLAKAEWAPDGRSILCFSEWGLRVTVWSLITGTATHIQYPLHPDKGYAFRADGRYFVLAERHKSKDSLGVYDALESYRMVRHFPLPTSSLASLSLSPTGNHTAVWEGPLEYKLFILNLAGDLLGTFSPDPDRGFGIRAVTWHPSGAFLAVAGWDDKIYILESLTWGPVVVLDLQSRIPAGVTVWREPSDWVESTQGRGFLSYERPHTPYTLSIIRPDLSKPYPKSGAIQLAFNIDGTLLLARFESSPNAVHLFSFPSPAKLNEEPGDTLTPRLKTVLLHSKPVVSAQWNPVRKGSLAISCGSGGMYMWSDEWVGENGGNNESEEVAECIGIPARQFEARDIKWAPDGKGLVLLDKDTFCCAFEVEDENMQAEGDHP